MKTKTLLLVAVLTLQLSSAAFGQAVDTLLSSGLSEPNSLLVDGSGTVFITDAANNRVMRYATTTGQLNVLAGSLNGDHGSVSAVVGTDALFYNPQGLVAARGGLVVADSANHLIRYVSFTGVVTNIAGSTSVAVPYLMDGVGTAARFLYPVAVTVAGDGAIYVADFGNNSIRKIATDNTVTTVITGLNQPTAVAVGDGDDLWVADRSNKIILYSTAGVKRYEVGTGAVGTNDAAVASATFNGPKGLVWMGAGAGLLVSDSLNHTLRRVYTNSQNTVVVQTVAGVPRKSGSTDGATNVATFNVPVGLAADTANGAFLVADSQNKSIRRLQQSTPLPPISDPSLGIIELTTDSSGVTTSRLTPVVNSVFNNDVTIGVTTETGTETLFTYGATPANAFVDTIPDPSQSSSSAVKYQNGDFPLPATMIPNILPDMTVKVQGTLNGRRPSSVIKARYQFKVASPSIIGNNAASFTFSNITSGAQMYYTIDGSDPTNVASASILGPVTAGTSLSYPLGGTTTSLLVKVRAFRQNYQNSEIVSNLFTLTNSIANKISLGFESGEGSSDFVASRGQVFMVPVTLSLLSGQTMNSLQFNLQVTNNQVGGGVIPVDGTTLGFQSMLLRFRTNTFTTILPSAITAAGFTNLLFTNSSQNLMGVGWLERAGATNLYDTPVQDLITYSQAHDTRFLKDGLKVVVGGFYFAVPNDATPGVSYTVRIGRPSATSDGIATDVFIEAPTNGATSGASPLNAVKTITVGQRKYLVGDVAPFRWFNAGDFGDTNLLANDVAQIFQSAVYGANTPSRTTDLFDAMDSSDGSVGLQNGANTTINNITMGDGLLQVDDVFVTFRRSLDPTLSNYFRYWNNGVRVAELYSGSVYRGAGRMAARSAASVGLIRINDSTDAPGVTFGAGDVIGSAGQTIDIPITAKIVGAYPLRVLMFNLNVRALDGSPAIVAPVQFIPAEALGAPFTERSVAPFNYAAVWLNDSIAGLTGDAVIGTLRVTIPTTAGADTAYAVDFEHASGSPNGLRLFERKLFRGLVTIGSRTRSSFGDAIPDSWRLRYFGSVSNLLSQAGMDADGDGVSNLQEFLAGTDPNDATSTLKVRPKGTAVGQPQSSDFTVRWSTAAGKQYVIESSESLFGGAWVQISPVIDGTGWEMEYKDTSNPNQARFYRVRVLQ